MNEDENRAGDDADTESMCLGAADELDRAVRLTEERLSNGVKEQRLKEIMNQVHRKRRSQA